MENLNRKLYFNLRILNRKMHQSKRQTLRGQNRVLEVLVENDGLSQGELVELLDIRPSSLSELLSKMEEKGDVYRREDENDKRVRYVFLSEVGKAKALELSSENNPIFSLFDVLSEEEKTDFSNILDKLVADFKDENGCKKGSSHRKSHLARYEEKHGKIDWDSLSDEEKHAKKREIFKSMKRHRRSHR